MYRFLFGDRDPVAEPGTSTGITGDRWTVFALVPDVFAHCVGGFRVYRSRERRLDRCCASSARRERALLAYTDYLVDVAAFATD